MRVCVYCNGIKTYINKHGTSCWTKKNDGFICSYCYAIQYRIDNTKKLSEYKKQYRIKNHEKILQNDRLYYKNNKEKWHSENKILFKNKRIILNYNPRKGICQKCGKNGRTNLHHIQYDDNDPLAHTIELCVGCHRKEHPQERDISGQFISNYLKHGNFI